MECFCLKQVWGGGARREEEGLERGATDREMGAERERGAQRESGGKRERDETERGQAERERIVEREREKGGLKECG